MSLVSAVNMIYTTLDKSVVNDADDWSVIRPEDTKASPVDEAAGNIYRTCARQMAHGIASAISHCRANAQYQARKPNDAAQNHQCEIGAVLQFLSKGKLLRVLISRMRFHLAVAAFSDLAKCSETGDDISSMK